MLKPPRTRSAALFPDSCVARLAAVGGFISASKFQRFSFAPRRLRLRTHSVPVNSQCHFVLAPQSTVIPKPFAAVADSRREVPSGRYSVLSIQRPVPRSQRSVRTRTKRQGHLGYTTTHTPSRHAGHRLMAQDSPIMPLLSRATIGNLCKSQATDPTNSSWDASLTRPNPTRGCNCSGNHFSEKLRR